MSTIGIGISLLLVPGVDEDVSHNTVNIIHVSLTALDSPYFKVSQDPCLNLTVLSGQNCSQGLRQVVAGCREGDVQDEVSIEDLRPLNCEDEVGVM